ncbi:MAG: hypothetical protein ACYDDF_12915 [Thermoplasmatota archaeon]
MVFLGGPVSQNSIEPAGSLLAAHANEMPERCGRGGQMKSSLRFLDDGCLFGIRTEPYNCGHKPEFIAHYLNVIRMLTP